MRIGQDAACYYFSVRRVASVTILLSLFSLLSGIVFGPSNASGQEANFDELAKSATAAREAGKTQEATRVYQHAVAAKPDWVEGWWYLGTLAYDADKYSEAIPAFQKVVELAPQLGSAWMFLGLCEFQEKQYDDARAHLEKGKELDDGEDKALARITKFHLAMLLIRESKFADATNLIATEFSQGNMPAQAQFAVGLAMLRVPLVPSEITPAKEGLVQDAGKSAAAALARGERNLVGAFPELVAKYPKTPFVYYAYAEALAENNEQQRGAEMLARERDVYPEGVLAKEAKNRPPDETAVKEELTDYYRGGAANATNGVPAEELWNQVLQDFSAKKFAEAISKLNGVVQARPEFGGAWAVLGLCEFELKQYDNARIHLQKGYDLGIGAASEPARLSRYALAVLQIRDGEFERATALLVPQADDANLAKQTQFALGMALLRMRALPDEVPAANRDLVSRVGEISILLYNSKYDLAFAKLKPLLAEYPKAPFLHYAYGTALSSLSQFPEARTQLLEEAKLSPQSELPYLRLASISLKLKRPEEALPFAQKALALAPRSAEAHYILGRTYLELDKLDEAIDELETTARLAPSSAEVHFQLARAYAKAKQPEKAAQARETFSRLNTELEKRKSRQGSQAYGAARGAGDPIAGGLQATPPAQTQPQ